MTQTLAQLVLALIVLGWQTQQVDPRQNTGQNSLSTKPMTLVTSEVRIRDIPASSEVFVRHDGPYWTIGADVTRVKNLMVSAAQSGPLFIRYDENPLNVSSGKQRVQVGFKSPGSFVPPEGFERSEGLAERVAVMIVQGRAPSLRRDYARILSWIRTERVEDIGTITEVYCGGLASDCQPVDWEVGPTHSEIRVVLKRTKEPALSERGATPELRKEPIEHAARDANTDDIGSSREPSTPTPVVPMLPTPIGAKTSRDGPAREQASQAQGVPVGQPRSQETIADLIAQEQFTQIARMLMPDHMRGSKDDQVWVAHIVMRIMAATDGIAQIFPERGDGPRRLYDVLQNRFGQYTSELHLDPRLVAMVPVQAHSEHGTAHWRELLKEIDDLLGAIAVQAVTSDEATLRLCAAIEQVSALVGRSDRP